MYEYNMNTNTKITLLKNRNVHLRDEYISFKEEGHKYIIHGDDTFQSVTTVVHLCFPQFNADEIIKGMKKGKNWNTKNKYWGKSDEEIKEGWNQNGMAASKLGSELHYNIECFMNEDVIDAETNENIEYDHEDLLTMYEEEIAQNPRTSLSKEWGFFINYVRDKPCFVPFRTEWTVYDEEIKIAGSIDMVYKDRATGHLKIYDWKRAKEIKRFDYKNGTNPIVSHLPNSNFWHYSLQLNIYKAILEKNYGYVVSELFLVRLHPENENNDYQLIQCADLSNEVNELFQERKQNITHDPNYYATKPHHP
jgi:hypothetical protein